MGASLGRSEVLLEALSQQQAGCMRRQR